jgi:ketosteroid isomerase-like protein
MDTAAYLVRSEDQVRDLLQSWLKAVRAKDVDAITSHYVSDVVAFDAISHLRLNGVEAYRTHWAACMDLCDGAKTFEMRDLAIETGGDVAFGHYLGRCGGTDAHGEERSCWMRVSVGCRRTRGRWKIAHEHFSVPFDLENGHVLTDLEP